MDRSPSLRIPAGVAALALTLGAALPLTRLFRGSDHWLVVVMAAAGSLALGWVSRRLAFGAIASWVLQLTGLLLFVSWRFLPGTLAGPLPTARTFGALGETIQAGARLINVEAAPVVPHDEILLFLALGIWVTAWLIDLSLSVVGNPLLAVASAIPLHAMPGTLVNSQRPAIDLAGFAIPALAILFLHQHRRSRRVPYRQAVTVALVGLTAGLVLLPSVPGLGASPLLPGTGLRRQAFNPFVAIKPALDRSRETTLFTAAVTRPGYWRLTALDRFDGKVWSQGPDQRRIPMFGPTLPPSRHDGEVAQVDQYMTISSLGGIWLPVAYDPESVRVTDILGGEIVADLDDEPRAMIVEEGVSRGMKINARSSVPVPRARDLDAAVPSTLRDRYLELPPLPSQIAQIAKDIAGAEPTPYRQAVALQRHLRTFAYDEDVAAGHGYSTLVEFLTEVKRGYCEQFAGSMAVLARSIGLPARVVIGFTAGRPLGRREDLYLFEVTSRHAHAWVEIYFSGHGWIAFEPTPRSGFATPPGYSDPSEEDLAGPAPGTGSTPAPTAAPSARPTARPTDGPDATGAAGGGFPAAPLGLGLGLVAAGVAAWLVIRRRPGAHPYRELLAWCSAAGLGRGESETPREHLSRLNGLPDPAGLADLLDQALWGDRHDPALDVSLGGARLALAGNLSPGRRLLAGVRWRLARRPRDGNGSAAG